MKTASIIIPAHNEANVLPATLSRLAADSMAESLEVFVVANACNDSTAATAREFADRLPGLVVIETQTPGKPNALNLGDAAASAFPANLPGCRHRARAGSVAGLGPRIASEGAPRGGPGDSLRS